MTIRPLAGTRPRGATPELDEALEAELRADPKERAEHLMLIDLARNDIGRIAKTGSVKVTEAFAIERYSHVMHIVSNVEGLLKDGMTNLDVLRATFPAGTLTGAPKIRAMEIIDELEPVKRGIYGGACGYLSYAGDMDVAIAIRTGIVKDGDAATCRRRPASSPIRCPSSSGRRPRPRRARCCARPSWSRRASDMLLMIDNYDSFTFNLVQYFGELGEDVRVFRNDEIDVDGIAALQPDRARALARAVLAGRGRRLRRRRSAPSPASCRSSASASATRRSARRSAARSCAPSGRCTARPTCSATTAAASTPACRERFSVIRYHSLAIERESLPARARGHVDARATARSWAFATASWRHEDAARGRAVPSRNRSSPSTATRC